MSEPTAAPPSRSGPTRATPVLLLAIAGALLVARVALGIFEEVRPVQRPERVEWREPGSGEAQALLSNRLVFYCFTSRSEPRCRQMSREVFSDPRMAEAIQRQFVPVRVVDLAHEGGRNPTDVARLEQEYGVTELPTLVVADLARTRYEKQAGYTGAMGVMQFISEATARLMLRSPGAGAVHDSTFGAPGGGR